MIERVLVEVRTLLGQPTMRQRLAELGLENIWAGPDATDAFVRAEFDG